jgi:predicted ATP-grasp superfamily ATP-dependent carboligase
MVMADRARERVLVLGDDMRIFLAVIRSLGRAGKEVHAAPFNWHSPALKSKYISKVHYFPRYSDDPVAWRISLLDVLRAHSFDLVLPCDDPAILPLHAHREELAGYPLAIPNPLAMQVLFDKERTHQLCGELGIPVVSGARLSSDDTAAALAGRFGLPIVMKPRQSYWVDRLDVRGKTSIIESEPKLKELLSTLEEPSRYLVEAYFEGVGVGVSVLAKNGKILHAFQHRRLREGRGGSSSYRVSEPVNDDLYRACERICRRTNLTGVCMFEFRWNPGNHNWILLETNARFWGSLPLPLSLGVDFPRYLYDLLVHQTEHAPVQYAVGIKSRNLLLDGFNLFVGIRHLRRGEFGNWIAGLGDFLAQPIRWLSGRERSDSFVSDDLRPALWECALLFKSLGQKLTRHRNPEPSRRRSEKARAFKLFPRH